MASLGSLAVNVVARTENFTRGVSKAISQTGRLASAVATAGPAIATGLAVAGAAFVSLARDQATAIDGVGKYADKIGATTEAVMGLHHAAELNGVSQNTFDMAVQRSTRRIAEAAQGSGEAVGALNELGLSAQRLTQMPLESQMGVLADAFAGVESQADRVRLAMKLFDSEGVAMVNVLRNGSAGLAEMRVEAAELGNVLSRDQVAAVEASNNAIARQEAAWTGVKSQLTAITAPAFTKFYNDLANSIAAVTGGSERRSEALKRELDLQKQMASVAITAEERRAAAIAKTNKVINDRIKATVEAEKKERAQIVAQQNSLLDSLEERRRTFGMDEEDRIIDRAQRTNVDPALSRLIIEEAQALKKLRLEKEAEAEAEAERLRLADETEARRKRNALTPTPELTARVSGSVDTFAAARRNLRGPNTSDKFLAELTNEAAEQTEILRSIEAMFGDGGSFAAAPINGGGVG